MYLAEFHAYLENAKSKTAQDKYTQAARAFVGYINSKGQTLQNLEPDALRSFIQWLTTPEKGVRLPGAATVHLMIAGVRSYFDFLRGKRVVITQQVQPHRPRLPQSLPLVMSREQLATYVKLCLADPDPVGTMLLLLPYCGLRVSEMCDLRLRDVLWHDVSGDDRRYILHVEKGKGGKERLTPMFTGPSCLISRAFHLYLTQERPKYTLDESTKRGERWLFPAPGVTDVTRVSVKTLQRRVRGWRAPMMMSEFHPHACRSHFATALLSIPLDPLEVARYLGHTTNLDTLGNHYAGVRFENVSQFMGLIARPTQAEYQAAMRQGRINTLRELRNADT